MNNYHIKTLSKHIAFHYPEKLPFISKKMIKKEKLLLYYIKKSCKHKIDFSLYHTTQFTYILTHHL